MYFHGGRNRGKAFTIYSDFRESTIYPDNIPHDLRNIPAPPWQDIFSIATRLLIEAGVPPHFAPIGNNPIEGTWHFFYRNDQIPNPCSLKYSALCNQNELQALERLIIKKSQYPLKLRDAHNLQRLENNVRYITIERLIELNYDREQLYHPFADEVPDIWSGIRVQLDANLTSQILLPAEWPAPMVRAVELKMEELMQQTRVLSCSWVLFFQKNTQYFVTASCATSI